MTITPSLFEAFLKCPTKCWLRFTDETPTGNNYAEWVQTESESYRIDAAKRLLATVPADECGPLPGSSRREESPSLAENLKAAQWRVATDVSVHTELRSSRGHEALTYLIFQNSCIEMSLLTSAATISWAVRFTPEHARGATARGRHTLASAPWRGRRASSFSTIFGAR